jgi:hypothetical protein
MESWASKGKHFCTIMTAGINRAAHDRQLQKIHHAALPHFIVAHMCWQPAMSGLNLKCISHMAEEGHFMYKWSCSYSYSYPLLQTHHKFQTSYKTTEWNQRDPPSLLSRRVQPVFCRMAPRTTSIMFDFLESWLSTMQIILLSVAEKVVGIRYANWAADEVMVSNNLGIELHCAV